MEKKSKIKALLIIVACAIGLVFYLLALKSVFFYVAPHELSQNKAQSMVSSFFQDIQDGKVDNTKSMDGVWGGNFTDLERSIVAANIADGTNFIVSSIDHKSRPGSYGNIVSISTVRGTFVCHSSGEEQSFKLLMSFDDRLWFLGPPKVTIGSWGIIYAAFDGCD